MNKDINKEENAEKLVSENFDPLNELFDSRSRTTLPTEESLEEVKKENLEDLASHPKKQNEEEVEELASKKEKDEFSKLQERLLENQKYARKHVQKVKNASKAVNYLITEGILNEEEAKDLLGALQSDEEEPEENYRNNSSLFAPFAPIFKAAKQELDNIHKYTEDDSFQDKLNAFEYFLAFSPQDEVEQVYEELNELVDDRVKLAKKILSIGKDAYDNSYKEIKNSGGIKNVIQEKNRSVDQLKKQIDKLQKKILQYESYDKPNYRIGGVGESEESEIETSDPLSQMFKARDTIKRR